jgi:hypothetical protein
MKIAGQIHDMLLNLKDKVRARVSLQMACTLVIGTEMFVR